MVEFPVEAVPALPQIVVEQEVRVVMPTLTPWLEKSVSVQWVNTPSS